MSISNCRNCGAPLKSCICEYCGSEFGHKIDKRDTQNDTIVGMYLSKMVYAFPCAKEFPTDHENHKYVIGEAENMLFTWKDGEGYVPMMDVNSLMLDIRFNNKVAYINDDEKTIKIIDKHDLSYRRDAKGRLVRA